MKWLAKLTGTDVAVREPRAVALPELPGEPAYAVALIVRSWDGHEWRVDLDPRSISVGKFYEGRLRCNLCNQVLDGSQTKIRGSFVLGCCDSHADQAAADHGCAPFEELT